MPTSGHKKEYLFAVVGKLLSMPATVGTYGEHLEHQFSWEVVSLLSNELSCPKLHYILLRAKT
jgi:hypothetical protein